MKKGLWKMALSSIVAAATVATLTVGAASGELLHDEFKDGAPTNPAIVYNEKVSPGDLNENSLVGSSWINASLKHFVTSNDKNPVFFGEGDNALVLPYGREICPDDTGVITYSIDTQQHAVVKLSVVGLCSIYGNMVKTDNWYYKAKWDKASIKSPNANAVLDPLETYNKGEGSDPGIVDFAATQYYVYPNTEKDDHYTLVAKDPDGNYCKITDYFAATPLDLSKPEDKAIVDACVPVFKFEESVDGTNYTEIDYSFETIGACSDAGLDEWQAATLKALTSKGAKNVRITINAPSMFAFEDPDQDVYGKPRWKNRGIFLADATINETDITKIEVKKAPNKVEYVKGADLDLNGAVIKVTLAEGTVYEIPVMAQMVTGFDKNQVGEQTITVTYGEKTATFTVAVKEEETPPVSSDPISSDSNKTPETGSFTPVSGLASLLIVSGAAVVLNKKKKR